MSIDKIFENSKKKYEKDDILHYVRSAMYFDDVPKKSWEAMNFLCDKISKNEVIEKLTYEVGNYQKKEILKNQFLPDTA